LSDEASSASLSATLRKVVRLSRVPPAEVTSSILNWYRSFLRPCLFQLDAEVAHDLSIRICNLAGRLPGLPSWWQRWRAASPPELACTVAGLACPNPIGLAAGWDKNGQALRVLDGLGFGFAEIGSVSSRPSHGNPRPRLFRLPADEAIVVNYGVPNEGATVVAERLRRFRPRLPLGVNIVATHPGPTGESVSEESIIEDYYRSVSQLHPLADYLMLNLSCPNTRDGREHFAAPGRIRHLMQALQTLDLRCPVFLKVSPTNDPARHDRLLEEVEPFAFLRGFHFNLPPGKPDWLMLKTSQQTVAKLPGAVAGKPVAAFMTSCLATLAKRIDPRRWLLFGGGGVSSGEEAYRQLRLGASLVPIYSALIYRGPGVVGRIQRELVDCLRRDGFQQVHEVVGCDRR
jgi:dihydroorotate dehydrogenase